MKMCRTTYSALSLVVFVSLVGFANAGALHDAIRKGDDSAFSLALSTTANLDETDYFLGTPLHLAVSENKIAYVKQLIDRGANIEAQSELDSMRALHLAANLGYSEIASLLLSNDADIRATADNGETPLIVAARHGDPAVVEVLLAHTSEFEIREETEGLTALAMAALHGNLDAAILLLDAGADIEAASTTGRSVLYLASLFQSYKKVGDGRLIRLLADRGADLNRKDDAGYTPLSYALTRPAKAYGLIAETLRELGAEE